MITLTLTKLTAGALWTALPPLIDCGIVEASKGEPIWRPDTAGDLAVLRSLVDLLADALTDAQRADPAIAGRIEAWTADLDSLEA